MSLPFKVCGYTGSRLQRKTARYKWLLVVKELFNIAVNYFHAKKSTPYSRVLVVSGTQCITVIVLSESEVHKRS